MFILRDMPTPSLSVISARRLARSLLPVFAFVAASALLSAPLAHANEPKSTEKKAAEAPLTTSIEKVKTDDGPPYVLKVKNTSSQPVKVSATVLLSVVAHNRDKARQEPERELAAGATWTIEELAAQDKVLLNAVGFAPREIVIK